MPELVTLVGYVGGTVANPATGNNWLLVYRDWRMITWFLIEVGGIVHLDTVPEDGDPSRARDVLWVGRTRRWAGAADRSRSRRAS